MAKTTDHLGRPIVVVTGIGIITSLGVGRKDNWDALSAGRSTTPPEPLRQALEALAQH